jgi:hypothetical protein
MAPTSHNGRPAELALPDQLLTIPNQTTARFMAKILTDAAGTIGQPT